MIKRWIEHREYQQLRRDQMAEKKFKQSGIVVLFCVALLFVGGAIEMVTKEVPTEKTVKPGAAVYQPVSTVSDAEKFTELVTMPAENLTPDDLEFLKSKENNPCYAGNLDVEQGMMAEEIAACEASS